MILNGQYIDKDFIIARVYRDYGFKLDESDLHERVWEIMSQIAVPNSFIDATAVIDIVDMKGRLPCNFYQMYNGGVREYYTRTPMRKSTNIYHTDDNAPRGGQSVCLTDVIGTTCIEEPTDTFTCEDTVVVSSPALQSEQCKDFTYNINNYYIFTNFDEGKIEMVYKAFPLDEAGFPLIPDDEKFIKAVVTYVAERHAFKLMLQDKFAERKYDRLAQEYYYCVAAVKSYSAVPSVDEMENIRQRATMLLKGEEQQINGFKYLNT